MIRVAWLLGWAPLRNSVRAAVYTRRGPDRPVTWPPAPFVVKALIVGAVLLGAPVALAGPAESPLLFAGSSPAALAALSWSVLCAMSLAFGFIAALGMSLPAALAMDHLLLSLPLRRTAHIAARLVALQLEGGFWMLLFAYPLILHAHIVQQADAAAQATAVVVTVLVSAVMVSLGTALAHALLALLPGARRTRLLVNALLFTLGGVGLGIVASIARSGRATAFDAAQLLSTVPFSPTWLPQQIMQALAANDAVRAATCIGALALLTVAASAVALGAMHLSHGRICFLEEP